MQVSLEYRIVSNRKRHGQFYNKQSLTDHLHIHCTYSFNAVHWLTSAGATAFLLVSSSAFTRSCRHKYGECRALRASVSKLYAVVFSLARVIEDPLTTQDTYTMSSLCVPALSLLNCCLLVVSLLSADSEAPRARSLALWLLKLTCFFSRSA